MTRLGSLSLIIAGALLLVPASLAGQTVGTSSGTISGTVRDSSGAILPAVTIVLTSPALMGSPRAVSNEEGLYRFPSLPPGEYMLVFTRDGFGTQKRDGLHVGVGFTATVDVVLDVAAREVVVVEYRSPVLDRQSTAIATNFDARQLGDIPGVTQHAGALGPNAGRARRPDRGRRQHWLGRQPLQRLRDRRCKPASRRRHQRRRDCSRPVSPSTTGRSRR